MASTKRLNATITIGGAISGTLKSAIGTTTSGLKQIGDTIREVDSRQKLLGKSIQVFGRAGKDVSAMRAEYAQLGNQVDRLRMKQSRLLAVEKARAHNREAVEAITGKIPGGHLIGAAIELGSVVHGLHAYEKINDAETDLRSALLDGKGQVPKEFEEIRRQAIQLHNVLPGTLADFHNVAVALKENGVSSEMIAGGALQAAAQLGVVLKMPVESAAEMTAKLREAFQLSEGELGRMADLSQRARFAFGLRGDDLLLGAKYYGGKLGSLGLSGADNVRRIYALQGMAAQNGIDGSTFGTNFGQMLTRAGMLNQRLARNSKPMKAVRDILAGYRIQMEFFDKKGNFAGIDNLVAQLSKLTALTQEKRLQVLQNLFGEEGARPAELISRKGVAGYQAALKAEDDQASLTQRIGVVMSSFTNKVATLTGSLETLVGLGFQPLGEALTPLIDQMNGLVSHGLIPWVEGHQKLAGVIETSLGALVAFRTATLAAKLASLLLVGRMLSVRAVLTRVSSAYTMAARGAGLFAEKAELSAGALTEVAAAGPEAALAVSGVGNAAMRNIGKMLRMRTAIAGLLALDLGLDAISKMRAEADKEKGMSPEERKTYEAKRDADGRQSFGQSAFGWIPGLDKVDWNKPINDYLPTWMPFSTQTPILAPVVPPVAPAQPVPADKKSPIDRGPKKPAPADPSSPLSPGPNKPALADKPSPLSATQKAVPADRPSPLTFALPMFATPSAQPAAPDPAEPADKPSPLSFPVRPPAATVDLSAVMRKRSDGDDTAPADNRPAPSSYTDARTVTITVHQQPGQDGKNLADDIIRQMDVRKGVADRSALYDPAMGGQ